jgi:hypothetical protein
MFCSPVMLFVKLFYWNYSGDRGPHATRGTGDGQPCHRIWHEKSSGKNEGWKLDS